MEREYLSKLSKKLDSLLETIKTKTIFSHLEYLDGIDEDIENFDDDIIKKHNRIYRLYSKLKSHIIDYVVTIRRQNNNLFEKRELSKYYHEILSEIKEKEKDFLSQLEDILTLSDNLKDEIKCIIEGECSDLDEEKSEEFAEKLEKEIDNYDEGEDEDVDENDEEDDENDENDEEDEDDGDEENETNSKTSSKTKKYKIEEDNIGYIIKIEPKKIEKLKEYKELKDTIIEKEFGISLDNKILVKFENEQNPSDNLVYKRHILNKSVFVKR